MMKRIAVLFMALLYTVTALGIAINLHYCFNEVASVKIDAPVKKCTTWRAAKAMKCCKDKHIDIKVKDGHQSSSTSFLSKIFVIDLPKLPFEEVTPAIAESFASNVSYRGPPVYPHSQPSIYIYLSNCNFRI